MKLQQVVYDYVIESTHAHAIIGYNVSISSLCVLAILSHNNFLIFARVCPKYANANSWHCRAQEFSDVAKSHMRNREFAQIKRSQSA